MRKESRAFAPIVYLRNRMPAGQGIYSGMMFAYYMGAACTSFAAAYLAEQGLSGSQVGTAMAVVSIFGILSTPVAGSLSDRLHSPRWVIASLLVIAGLLYLCVGLFGDLVLFSLTASVVILPVWSFFKTPMQSLLDSMTVSTVNRRRTFTYGSVRSMGSIGYGVFCLVITFLTTRTGSLRHVFFSYGIVNFITLMFILMDPERKTETTAVASGTRKKQDGGVKMALSSFYFRMFLGVYMLVCVPTYCLTTFLPYKLIAVTGSSDTMGTLIAFKGFMEVPALLLGARITQKLGQKGSLVLCMTAFALEQSILLFAGNIALIEIALLMEGLINGLFISCAINYIYAITPHEASSSAQTIAGALTSVASILGSFVGGFLVDAFGPAGFYTFTLILEGVALVLFLLSFALGKKLGHALPAEGI